MQVPRRSKLLRCEETALLRLNQAASLLHPPASETLLTCAEALAGATAAAAAGSDAWLGSSSATRVTGPVMDCEPLPCLPDSARFATSTS